LLPPQIVLLPMQAPRGSLSSVLSVRSRVVESDPSVLTSVVESALGVLASVAVDRALGVLTFVVLTLTAVVPKSVVLALTAVVPPVTGMEVVPGRLHPVEVAVPSHNCIP
jgi:Mg2+/Co2+ transporter CorB